MSASQAGARLKITDLPTRTAKRDWRQLDQRIQVASSDIFQSLNRIDGRAGLRRLFELIGLRTSPEQRKLAEAAEAERFARIVLGA